MAIGIHVRPPEECPLLNDNKLSIDNGLCEADFEVCLDHLASQVGMVATLLQEDCGNYNDLVWLTQMIYHLSTAIRIGVSLTSDEVERIVSLGNDTHNILPNHMILPVSDSMAGAYCHIVRSECRQVLIMLHKFDKVIDVDQRLFDIFNSLSSYFFILAVDHTSFIEKFESRDYK